MAGLESETAQRYWFSWRDAESDVSYGESNLYAVACELARRVSSEPLIDGRPQDVDLYEEPARRLLARYRGGQAAQIAAPTPRLAPAQGQARPASRSGVGLDAAAKRKMALLVHERDEIATRRSAAGLPDDAWHVRYLVIEERGTEAVLGWGADEAEARDIAGKALAEGREVQARESLDWTLVDLD